MPADRQLRFTAQDMQLFAAASGDHNPLHSDPEHAATTAFGTPIVHGSLIAIAMLGAIPAQALARTRELRVWFSGAILPETTVSLSSCAPQRAPGTWEVRMATRGRTVARVLARSAIEPKPLATTAEAPRRPVPATPATTAGTPPRPMRTKPAEPDVRQLSAGHVSQGRYAPGPGLDTLARRFGAAALDPRLLQGLAWASYVVGMELPGLHSLFAGLELAVDDAQESKDGIQTLVVRDRDERTGQLTIDGTLAARSGSGTILARIDCFALEVAVPPDPTALGLEGSGEPDRDRGAVVVAGGSRGFGASLALALLAQGYEVHVAYASSVRSAAELARLAGAHEPRLHMTQTDLRDSGAVRSLAEALAAAGRPLAGLALSAAPPPLAMSLTFDSAPDLAGYVAMSLQLFAAPLGALLPLLDAQRGWVLLCSSTALVRPPRDWPHYVSAKAAVEGLAGWVATTQPTLRTVVVRAPKMRTAMTATPSGTIGAVSADAVAAWTAERLAEGALEPGLTTLEPAVGLP